LRLVHAESDGLPGLVVDRYASALVVQYLAAGAERWRETIAAGCQSLSDAQYIYERSDVDVRRLEGLPERVGPLRGGEPPERIRITEPGVGGELRFDVDVRRGHKTAFYLDQRLNRKRVGELSAGRHVLDCFTYSGGFALHAAAGGAASVLAVDASAEALAHARHNEALNPRPLPNVDWLEADVFGALRSFRDARRAFDLVILDPPKFAPTAAQAERAARGYKDINLLALKLLRPGGLLVTFSCSGGIGEDLFQKIVAGAALDAGLEAQILERLHQAPDHPVSLSFPEGAYLKGMVLRVAG
jgi:23S rRNA (cytosine1962-C5)-methyltransferase